MNASCKLWEHFQKLSRPSQSMSLVCFPFIMTHFHMYSCDGVCVPSRFFVIPLKAPLALIYTSLIVRVSCYAPIVLQSVPVVGTYDPVCSERFKIIKNNVFSPEAPYLSLDLVKAFYDSLRCSNVFCIFVIFPSVVHSLSYDCCILY